jgi:predicted NBD/HSP70 family sugar kinase
MALARDSSAVSAGALLALIRERPRTRGELLDETGLSRSTLWQRLETLAARGLVTFGETAASTGGRRAALVTFDPSGGVILAGQMGHTHTHLAVTDLAGTPLVDGVQIADNRRAPETAVEALVEQFDALLERAGRKREDVRALGLGVPGPVEFAAGHLVRPPRMPDWDRFPLADELQSRLGVPVLVDNDVNVEAIGEHRLHWPEVDNLVYVKVGTGIGAGVIVDGRLYRGTQGSAGDIAHIEVPGHEDVICVCGNTGCLGAIAAASGLTDLLRDRGVPITDVADLLERVHAEEREVMGAVRDAGLALGRVLASVVNLLNPAIIVLGGALVDAGEPLLAGVRAEVYRRSTALATRELQIVPTASGAHAGVLGASVLALDRVLDPVVVDRELTADRAA